MSGGGAREAVKIVIIETQYVETDAVSFKSVVQKLTGKDSTITTSSPMSERRFLREEERTRAGVEMPHGGNLALMRDLSFKEFDRLLKELPSVDDLYRIWAD